MTTLQQVIEEESKEFVLRIESFLEPEYVGQLKQFFTRAMLKSAEAMVVVGGEIYDEEENPEDGNAGWEAAREFQLSQLNTTKQALLDECSGCDGTGHIVEDESIPTKQAIGFMRQWLNEDRITDPKKMVTDEELEYWFGKHTLASPEPSFDEDQRPAPPRIKPTKKDIEEMASIAREIKDALGGEISKSNKE
jgi:hypothetical protein